MRFLNHLKERMFNFITQEETPSALPPCDYEKIQALLKPGDVILIQGLNRLNSAMQYITKSIWTHAALCVGRANEIQDETLKNQIKNHYKGNPNEILIIEGIVGKVTQVVPLNKYKKFNLRICRPIEISEKSLQQVITYAISAIGYDISLWQVSRLFRLLLSWSILPNWLFAGLYRTKQGFRSKICSTIIAEAFASAKFPILPTISRDRQGKYHLRPYDPRLFFPALIDYSPYFEIIKYPLFGIKADKIYKTTIG